ncbi:MAG: hypothetical protein AAF664_25775, partial [Planctomycetota bacterium]
GKDATLTLYAYGTDDGESAIKPLSVRTINSTNTATCERLSVEKISVHSGTLSRGDQSIDNGDFRAAFFAVRESAMALDNSPKIPDMDLLSTHISEPLREARDSEDRIILFVFSLTGGGMPIVKGAEEAPISPNFVQLDGQNLSGFGATDWSSKSTPIHLMDGFRFVEFFDWFGTQVVAQIEESTRDRFSKRGLSTWCINTIFTPRKG